MSKGIEKMVIERALALIEKGFMKKAVAATRRGKHVEVTSDEAVKFCAVGAIERAMWELTGQERFRDAVMIVHNVHERLMSENDEKGKERVIQLFKQRLAEL